MSDKGFTIIQTNLILDKNLTTSEKLFIITIMGCDYGKTNLVTITYMEFMSALSTTRRTKISDIIKSLVAKGYISVHKKGSKRAYSIIKNYGKDIVKTELNNHINVTDKNKVSDEIGTNDHGNSHENETVNSPENGTEFSPKSETHINNINNIIQEDYID